MNDQINKPGAKVVITGGAGFLGSALARQMLRDGTVDIGGCTGRPIQELILLDLVAPPQDLSEHQRVQFVAGELAEATESLDAVDCIFHLAGAVSGAAEADFDLGMRTNVDGTRALLEYARNLPSAPVVVFASSLAVYGSEPAAGPLGLVDDATLPRPQSSYGVQKFIGEQLVADYTRKGFLRGRSLRLMTVSVRPGTPNAAASSFMSAMIREPLAGLKAVCPVAPDTELAIASPASTINGLLRAAAVDETHWGSRTAMNLPALTTTPREMAAALDRVTGRLLSSLIEWKIDPDVAAIVESWPARFSTDRAAAIGLEADSSFDEIVREYASYIACSASVDPRNKCHPS